MKAVAAGAHHSLALAEDGTVYSWGCGTQVSSPGGCGRKPLWQLPAARYTCASSAAGLCLCCLQLLTVCAERSSCASALPRERGHEHTWSRCAVLQGQLGHGQDAVPRLRSEAQPRRVRALDGQAVQLIAAGRSHAGADRHIPAGLPNGKPVGPPAGYVGLLIMPLAPGLASAVSRSAGRCLRAVGSQAIQHMAAGHSHAGRRCVCPLACCRQRGGGLCTAASVQGPLSLLCTG